MVEKPDMLTLNLGPVAAPIGLFLIALALLVAAVVGRAVGRGRKTVIGYTLADMLIAAALAARVAFVVTWFDTYRSAPWTMLDIRDGGFTPWAGIAAALLVALWQGWRNAALRRPLSLGLAAGALTWAGIFGALSIMSNTSLPTTPLTTLAGEPADLAKLAGGKPIVVNLWATWCPPCRQEVPDLIALQTKYGEKVVVLGLSTDEGSPDAVKAFVEKYGINYPVAQVGAEMERLFAGVTALPTSFIIDQDGNIVQKHVGMLNARLTELETRALAGLATNITVERIEAGKPMGLENAAQAREIPGVELAHFSPEKRVEALLKLNADSCTCGCGLTVARCRVDDPECSVSLPLAKTIVAAIDAR